MNTPRNNQESKDRVNKDRANKNRANKDKENKDQEFASNAQRRFERSVASLDAATLSQLNRRRQRALAEVAARKPMSRWVRWMPAAGVAAAAAIAVVMLQVPTVYEWPVLEPAEQDLEILIGDDNLEMLEDLEFYSVLDTLATDNVG